MTHCIVIRNLDKIKRQCLHLPQMKSVPTKTLLVLKSDFMKRRFIGIHLTLISPFRKIGCTVKLFFRRIRVYQIDFIIRIFVIVICLVLFPKIRIICSSGVIYLNLSLVSILNILKWRLIFLQRVIYTDIDRG